MKRLLCLLTALCLCTLSAFSALCESVPARQSGVASAAALGEAAPIDDKDDKSETPGSVPVSEEAGENSEDEEDDSEVVPVEFVNDDDFEEEILEARILQYGDEGDDVHELQQKLADLCYYTGNISGVYKEGTQAAVKKFQQDFDLEPTGVADTLTQSVLFSTVYRPLRYGSTGEDVKRLQTRLTALGYYTGKISGNYLEGTQSAIKQFQEKNGLDTGDDANQYTQSVLYSANAIGKNDQKPAATATPAPELGNYLVDENRSDTSDVVMPEKMVAFKEKLKNGMSGESIKNMQLRMQELGYYDGPISGNFLKYTTRAVKAIQKQNGLPSNGVVDEATWNVIFNDPDIVMPDATPKPTPTPEPPPFAITVDVTNQVVTVYGRDENGNYSVIVRQMLCSTGLKATPSDVGDWVLSGRKAQWCTFPKWGGYARYWTKINGNIAFHSPIYHTVSNTDMKVSSYNKLGQRASHGCIRLSVPDAKWIFDNCGAGTVVSIVEGMPSDPELRDALKLPPLNTKYMTPVKTPEPTAEPEYHSDTPPDLGGRVLQKGSNSADVYWVQKRLTELGFYKGKISGHFLSGTENAVKRFQQSVRDSSTGKVNQALIKLMAEAAVPTPTPGPSAAPSVVPDEVTEEDE